jgi:flagellar protein FlaG
MIPHQAPKLQISESSDYKESYSISQTQPDTVNITNFQGVYLSPQQAKALANLLNQNIAQYEGTFGEIRLEPANGGSGPVQ